MRYGVIPWILAGFLALGASGARAENPSLDRILPQVRQHHPGKFYDAEGPWRGPDGRDRYRLKWMTPDGRIVWFDADARTGRALGPDFQARGGMRDRPQFRDDDRPQFRDDGRPQFRDDDRRYFPDDDRRWNRGGRWPREGGPRMGRPHGGGHRR